MDKTFVDKIHYMANWDKIAAQMLDENQMEISLDDKNVHSTSCLIMCFLSFASSDGKKIILAIIPC